jgi:magnesium transporter
MSKFIRIHNRSKGSAPGSLIFVGDQKQDQVRIRVMNFDANELVEQDCTSVAEAFDFIGKKTMTWINIDGIHDAGTIQEVGSRLQVNHLILEDIMNAEDRPKYEESEELVFIIIKLLNHSAEAGLTAAEQLSLLIGRGVLVTFQERVGLHFDAVRERIRNTNNKSRLIHPDYLAYALLDCAVDNYMEIIAMVGRDIDPLDDEVISNPNKQTPAKIFRHRTNLNFLHRSIRPLKEICNAFIKSDSPLLQEMTEKYLRDLSEHVEVSLEFIEFYQTMIMDLYNMYNVSISNRANEIMKTLTIFASLFIPLTFVAGIYGMNFNIIPELSWKWGYLYFWILILGIGAAFLLYFKKRKWF